MSDTVYEKLADALNRLPNGFPRTPSNIEIPMLKKIFNEEEAELAGTMGRDAEPVSVIAERIRRDPASVKTLLKSMTRRGIVWFRKKDNKPCYRLAPFIVGIFEEFMCEMDHEFAHLFEEYMHDGGALGIMKPLPALHRVVPARGSVKSEYILPYDDVKVMLEKAISFRVRDCVCRKQQELCGDRRCDFPMKMCLNFTVFQRQETESTVSRQEALQLLDKAEDVGLVHTVSNVMKGMYYVCNCCGCCCGILRGITDWGIEESVACANYYAWIDDGLCTQCGLCQERCQVHAITEDDEKTVIVQEQCIGCGLCVTGCPSGAVKLIKKADAKIIHPPADFEAWEQLRLKNRDIIS